jgi:zinc protease
MILSPTVLSRRAASCALLLGSCLAGVSLARAEPSPPGSSPIAARQTGAPAPTSADAVLRATLDNGLRVVIVPDRLAPVVTTEINYLTGSVNAPEGFPGTAHALEHMMFRGSKGLDREQLADLAARLGGDYNADTTEDVTQYFYTAPAEDLATVLQIEALRMGGLTLSEADWDKERGAIEQEVSRDLSDPLYKYFAQVQSIVFAGTPYEHDALGTRPSFDRTTAALLRKFYETWYAPNNAVLVIAGDVDPTAALAQVRRLFDAIPRRAVPASATVTVKPFDSRTIDLPTDLPVGVAALAWAMPGSRSADFATADILGDVIASRRAALYGLVPEGRALEASYVYRPLPQAGMAIAYAAYPRGADPQALIGAMRGIVADVARNGVSAELVEAMKKQELAQLAFGANSISGLANLWSETLAFKGLGSPDDLARAYAAVTPEAVSALAKRYLLPDHEVTAILTPRDSGAPVSSKGFGGAESFASPPTHPVTLPGWAEAAIRKLIPPTAPVAPFDTTLANGLRLIVQPSAITHTVTLVGQVRQEGAMQTPPGQEGVDDLTAALFDYGTPTHDRIGLQKAIDDLAAKESAGPVMELKTLTPQFDAGLALLADNELHPAFPERAFTVTRQQLAQGLAGELTSPDYLFGRAVKSAILPKGDPALRQATPGSVMKLSLDDVRAFYHAAYRPDLTTLVIVGDITPDHAKAAVERAFGGWTAQGPTPAIDLPSVPLSTSTAAHVPDSSSVQDEVTLAETLGIGVHDPQHFLLTLGNTVLADGFSSRLFRDLRVKTGYVYSVSSRFHWGRTRTSYTISFGADAKNVRPATALALHDLGEMTTTPVADSELTLAKASLLRQVPMQRASVDDIAEEDLYLAGLGMPLDTPYVGAQHYYDATPDAVRNAFKTWLRPAAMSQVVKGPALP